MTRELELDLNRIASESTTASAPQPGRQREVVLPRARGGRGEDYVAGRVVRELAGDNVAVLIGWSGRGNLIRNRVIELMQGIEGYTCVRPPTVARRALVRRAIDTTVRHYGYERSKAVSLGTGITQYSWRSREVCSANIGDRGPAYEGTCIIRGEVPQFGGIYGERVRAEYERLRDTQTMAASDVTAYLQSELLKRGSFRVTGLGWYVPAVHASFARQLYTQFCDVWGEWSEVSITDSAGLAQGITRGFISEIDDIMRSYNPDKQTRESTAIKIANELVTQRERWERARVLIGDECFRRVCAYADERMKPLESLVCFSAQRFAVLELD